jgi:hypothetical protein
MLMSVEPALSALHETIAAQVNFDFESDIQSFGVADHRLCRGYSERLIQKGWCPFVIASAEIAMPVFFFLRYIDAAGYALRNGGHEICTSDACKRNQIDFDTYAQLHWKPRCRCRYIKQNIDKIFEIFGADLIPVV